MLFKHYWYNNNSPQCDATFDFLQDMLDFESHRVFSEDAERNILLNLEVLSVLKSRLDSIQESGALSGSLKNLEMRLQELKV